MKSINHATFYNCASLTHISIPDGVTIFEGDIFSNCTSLASIVIPTGLTYININHYTFENCNKLKTIFYKGTKVQYEATESNIEILATVYFYSNTEPPLNTDGTAYNDNYWHYDKDGVTPIIWKR